MRDDRSRSAPDYGIRQSNDLQVRSRVERRGYRRGEDRRHRQLHTSPFSSIEHTFTSSQVLYSELDPLYTYRGLPTCWLAGCCRPRGATRHVLFGPAQRLSDSSRISEEHGRSRLNVYLSSA